MYFKKHIPILKQISEKIIHLTYSHKIIMDCFFSESNKILINSTNIIYYVQSLALLHYKNPNYIMQWVRPDRVLISYGILIIVSLVKIRK